MVYSYIKGQLRSKMLSNFLSYYIDNTHTHSLNLTMSNLPQPRGTNCLCKCNRCGGEWGNGKMILYSTYMRHQVVEKRHIRPLGWLSNRMDSREEAHFFEGQSDNEMVSNCTTCINYSLSFFWNQSLPRIIFSVLCKTLRLVLLEMKMATMKIF